MVELTIDGKKVEVPEGSMVMQAANKLGLYVPHFCYHKKLSIAANCRMCLVEVEKAPKAMPACATPVTSGMIVHTASAKAVAAQKSVMEFLLINHPLDCPVCDQGGECQLQDLAVGYGASASRYQEEKRVVFHKEMGPLVAAEEMQRCIHCTRCVRFGQEVGGLMELGMLNRGEHAEITSFVGRAVESELSGNMIDICPVGALTSKPFRYTARTWELARRRSVSPHDSVGANLVVQVKGERVMRVVPFENEEINECWISDRDRFAYTGLYTEDRLAHPMIRTADGRWREASWSDALQAVVKGLNDVREQHGAGQIGALGTEGSTLEELTLLARLTRSLGSENVDFRLRQTDAELDRAIPGVPWLGMPIAQLGELDRVLVVGSFLRKDHPLFAQRLRQAAKRGTQISFIDGAADDPLFPVHARLTVTPGALPNALAEVLVALARAGEQKVPDAFGGVEPGAEAVRIAASLASGQKTAILLGNLVIASPQASLICANAQALAQAANAKLGFLTAGGNTVGGYVAGAVPVADGLNAKQMFEQNLKAYVVLHAEPRLDADNGVQAVQALKSADFTVALTSYRSAVEEWAHVMLPVAPFTETSGTFINAEGRAQSFKGCAAPFVDTRPAWKVLRVMGNLFELPGFDDETSESIRDSVLVGGVEPHLSNEINGAIGLAAAPAAVERLADIPIYRSDAMLRRAEPLQQTAASQAPQARMCAATLTSLGLESGQPVRVRSQQGEITLDALLDDAVAPGAVRIAAAFAETAALGSSFGQLSVEGV
ncbi:NADH-quinone oxidoreductase subunit NuoG [Eoetvoesiella caeni]|uniref:NADH-quinone oxidoreductase n=1 Tax=Eoetvoesiella caeni TaxID=645616 RepID=A0A366HKR3_9BURK|nr:NADH-quinone oxidoreductase subunit NuoG [Eoetvoesiella caeni]MCI2807069.1 NADH-quinone oxidoreductase subunit NuoG [Eoetvoesiella caeni]NYT53534.1 NADH-quinone oxidoreductase subunit G [Eoetvoesiella caeni]RBP43520.1 NADH dehydrogenase subunit G [Eoetvoesiella caeni]